MSGHTPGPWHVDDDGAIRTRDGRDVVAAFDHRVVVADADARLIAAAPDLLAALEAAHGYFVLFGADRAIAICRGAIQSARGKP